MHFGAVKVVMTIMRTECALVELTRLKFAIWFILKLAEYLIVSLFFFEDGCKLLGRKMINNAIMYRFDIILESLVAEEVHCYYF